MFEKGNLWILWVWGKLSNIEWKFQFRIKWSGWRGAWWDCRFFLGVGLSKQFCKMRYKIFQASNAFQIFIKSYQATTRQRIQKYSSNPIKKFIKSYHQSLFNSFKNIHSSATKNTINNLKEHKKNENGNKNLKLTVV